MPDSKICEHIKNIKNVEPKTPDGCEECLKEGSNWVQLRMCRECGHVGCCDSSVGKHANQHFKETSHPVMQSYKASTNWLWCYIDEIMIPE